jgi:predicted HD superfamily hydrolase involved in NAD metabolism
MVMKLYEKRLRELISPSRFEHVCRVADMAQTLAKKHGGDEQKAFLAGLLHDSAKQQSPESMIALGFSEKEVCRDIYATFPKVWHAFVAPQFCDTLFSIKDKAVHSAMFWHTTGSSAMSELDKIVFLADFVELGRSYPSCSVLRELAFFNLDEACYGVSATSIHSLIERSLQIHPESLACYNYYASQCSVTRAKEIIHDIKMA